MCLSATSLQCQQPHSSVSTVPGPGPGFRQTACWPAAPRFPSVIVLRTHFRQGPNSADDPASHLANSLKAVQVLCRQPLDCAGPPAKTLLQPFTAAFTSVRHGANPSSPPQTQTPANSLQHSVVSCLRTLQAGAPPHQTSGHAWQPGVRAGYRA